jgi:hypothetical protein
MFQALPFWKCAAGAFLGYTQFFWVLQFRHMTTPPAKSISSRLWQRGQGFVFICCIKKGRAAMLKIFVDFKAV